MSRMISPNDAKQRYVFINQRGAPRKSAHKRRRAFIHVQRARVRNQAQAADHPTNESGPTDEHIWPRSPESRDFVLSEHIRSNEPAFDPEISCTHYEEFGDAPQASDNQSASTPVLIINKRGQPGLHNGYTAPIDSVTHQLITYYKLNILFMRHQVNEKNWIWHKCAVADWHDTTRNLEDPGHKYAFLAQVTAFFATETSHSVFLHWALIYAHWSTAILRRQLESDEGSLDSVQTFRHINLLYGAEITMRNPSAAHTHGKMLRRLFDRKIGRSEPFDVKLLLDALYKDVLMSITFMAKPHFQPDEILPRTLGDPFLAPRHTPKADSIVVDYIDFQVEGMKLRKIFSRIKQSLALKPKTIAKAFDETADSYDGRNLCTLVNQLELMNHILDTEERIANEDGLEHLQYLHAQAYTSIAALFLIRLSTVPEHLYTKTFFDTHHELFERLRYYLDINQSLEMKHKYSRARLWALSVGAQIERQATLLHGKIPRSTLNDWFSVRFVRQADELGLSTWSRVRAVLKRFLYCETVACPPEFPRGLS